MRLHKSARSFPEVPMEPDSGGETTMHEHWLQPETRVKQFWYVSFCLMMSSAQDRLTGIALRASGNLNWATTAFYYSAVHAGRLICFVHFGDFPVSHDKIARLVAGEDEEGIQLNWLKTFVKYAANQNAQFAVTNVTPVQFRCAMDTRMSCLRREFDRFAPLLLRFKNLRNDCNYEALLVAHEKNHHLIESTEPWDDHGVTQGFSRLVEVADKVSRMAVDLSIDAYRTNLQRADCFATHRDQFHAAHNEYVRDRFQASLSQKVGCCGSAHSELERLTNRLEWPSSAAHGDLGAFLDPIMYNTFGEKQGLMARWRDDIRSLADGFRE